MSRIGQLIELKRQAEEIGKLLKLIEDLQHRVAELEAKRGPGRPKKESE